jgi:copper chaperone NosL
MEASEMNSKLSKPSVIAMLMVAVMILGVFVFPLWVISLVAPQYPQGLGLLIHVNRIEGITPFDLQNINGLNHYIGMHKIEPGTIQELRYMKYFALGLALSAALVALIRRRSALLVWALIAVVLAGIGMYDFYKWEYRYGHDLDPTAAIKVPGMSYQPPIFGTKQLLNFRTTAYPGIGGWLAMIAVALGVACVVYECWLRGRIATSRTRQVAHRATPLTAGIMLCVAFAGASALSGCAKKPATIAFGTDACEHCSMTITDQRYGAILVTDKGRSYKFDSVECMMGALAQGEKLAGATVHSFYVMDYAHPGQIIDASHASFLVSPNLPSPMGANVSSFGQEVDANHVQTEKGGDIMTWGAVQRHIQEWEKS